MTAIVVSRSKRRHDFDGSTIVSKGFVELLEIVIGEAPIEVRAVVVGILLNRLRQRIHCPTVIAPFQPIVTLPIVRGRAADQKGDRNTERENPDPSSIHSVPPGDA